MLGMLSYKSLDLHPKTGGFYYRFESPLEGLSQILINDGPILTSHVVIHTFSENRGLVKYHGAPGAEFANRKSILRTCRIAIS